MSRHLPPQPNLEHLKKQAKDLLHDMQERDPASKLADAQHAIAREYGFLSWPKLKAHVESQMELLSRPATSAPALVAPSSPSDDDGVVNVGNDPPSDSRPATAPETTNPFVGTWTANLSKSQRHPLNQFQSATLQFEVVGDTVTITHVGVDASGNEEHGKNTIQADGREHVSKNGHGYVFTARWLGTHVLETVATKDGQVVGRGMYEVSADGKTLTISTKNANEAAHGWQTDFEQVIVLDRQ